MDDLLALLRDSLGLDDELGPDTALISSGLVDSFGVIGLLGDIETRYDVIIEPEEVDAETFDTPRQILRRIDAGGA
jgi:D-alanine--poly(phosphoribitol) ligase subunit 2